MLFLFGLCDGIQVIQDRSYLKECILSSLRLTWKQWLCLQTLTLLWENLGFSTMEEAHESLTNKELNVCAR